MLLMLAGAGRLALPGALLGLPALAQAQATGRVPTVTRLVQLFGEREAALAQALAAGNRAAVDAMLTDDFELRAAGAPARPVPRAAWLDAMAAHPPAAAEPVDMAVHDLRDHAIASFALQPRDGSTRWFVVDVWRRAGADWKLAVRYIGPVTGPTPPGAEAPTGTLPKRY